MRPRSEILGEEPAVPAAIDETAAAEQDEERRSVLRRGNSPLLQRPSVSRCSKQGLCVPKSRPDPLPAGDGSVLLGDAVPQSP